MGSSKDNCMCCYNLNIVALHTHTPQIVQDKFEAPLDSIVGVGILHDQL